MSLIGGRKVFGIGLNKTGTTSLGDALNLLGIPSIHYPFKQATYDELRSGNYRLSILDHYQAIVDTPVAPYYPQLDQVYPGSKFVLTIRDTESWLRSIAAHWPVMREWCKRDPQFGRFTDFISAVVYGCIEFNAERFSYAYETHNRNVIEYFAGRPNDLLVMNVSSGNGWQQLCTFLEVAIPDLPFPHSNQGRRRGDANEWIKLFDLARDDVASILGHDEVPILIDDGKVGEAVVPAGQVIPFTESLGVYAGPPADDQAAIEELTRLRRMGANKLVLTWASFWWIDHYREFGKYLRDHARCLLKTDRVHVYEISA